MTAAGDLAAVRGLLERDEDRRVPLRGQLYRLYLAVLFGAVAYVVVVMPIGAAAPSAVATDLFAQWAPGVLSALGFGLLVAGARFGSWAGPVLVSRPDADWLLTSPLPRRELLRPHLVIGVLAGTGLGACAGLSVGLASAYLTPAAPWAVIAAAVAGWAALGALAAAVSWFVESSPRAPGVVLRVSPLGLLVALALVVGGLGTHLVVWTGPWGWASLPLLQVADQAVAGGWAGGALVASLAVGGVAVAIRAVESVHHEQLASRAGVRHGLLASAYVLDLRALSLIREERHRPLAALRTVRLRPPRSPRLAVAWRDAVALARRPTRLVWAVTLVSGGVGIAAAAPTAPLVVAGAAGVAYLGAAQLLEPMRIEADDPQHSELLPIPFPRLVLEHAAMPTLVLTVAGWAAVVGWALAGAMALDAVVVAIALAPGGALLLVASGALATVRLDSPLDYLLYGEYGVLAVVGALVKGPMLAAVLVAAPVVVLGELDVSTAVAFALVAVYLVAGPCVAAVRVHRRARVLARGA